MCQEDEADQQLNDARVALNGAGKTAKDRKLKPWKDEEFDAMSEAIKLAERLDKLVEDLRTSGPNRLKSLAERAREYAESSAKLPSPDLRVKATSLVPTTVTVPCTGKVVSIPPADGVKD